MPGCSQQLVEKNWLGEHPGEVGGLPSRVWPSGTWVKGVCPQHSPGWPGERVLHVGTALGQDPAFKEHSCRAETPPAAATLVLLPVWFLKEQNPISTLTPALCR